MMKGRRFFLLLCGLWMLSSAGCSLTPARRLYDESYRRVNAEGSASLEASLQSRASGLQTLRSLWETSITHSLDSYFVRHAIVVRGSGEVRVETLPMTAGYTVSLLIAGKNQVVFMDVAEKTAYFGSVQELTKRLLHVPLDPHNLSALATGRVPPAAFAKGADYLVAPDGAILVVADEGRSEWMLNEERLVSRAQVYGSDGSPDYAVSYPVYSDVSGLKLPEKIRIELPRLSVTLELTRLMATVNKPVPDKLFQASVPGDYERVGE